MSDQGVAPIVLGSWGCRSLQQLTIKQAMFDLRSGPRLCIPRLHVKARRPVPALASRRRCVDQSVNNNG